MKDMITEKVIDGSTGEKKKINYLNKKVVGHGSFGVVYQIQIVETEEVCAIKKVLQDARFKNRELQIMQMVHHQNIVDLKYFFYQKNEKEELYLNLILEFLPETIYKASYFYLQRKINMPTFEVKLYMYQLLRALNYIHSENICHRDIKPQNLLLNPVTGVLKLCDFGSAKILNPAESNVSYICSRYYRAPELIFGAVNYTTKIDIWSVGCVMAELIIGQPLFPGDSGIDQLVEIIKMLGTPTKSEIKSMNPDYMEQKFPIIKAIPLQAILCKSSNPVDEKLVNVLYKFLDYNPTKRISAVDAMADEFFDELRDAKTRLPNYRKKIADHSSKLEFGEMPRLFDFEERELPLDSNLRSVLIPDWHSSTS